jgi:hypothetical protein
MASLRDQIQASIDAMEAERRKTSTQMALERYKFLNELERDLSKEEIIERSFLAATIPTNGQKFWLEQLLKEYDAFVDTRSTVQK